MTKIKGTDRIIVGPVAISFPSLFQKNELSDKYGVDIIYEAGSETHKKLAALDKEAIKERWPEGAPVKLLKCVRKGDDKENPSDEYKGMLYSKLQTNNRPRVTGPSNEVIDDPGEMRGGNLCIVSVAAFPYDNTKYKKKGVYLTLHGIRKLQEGEPFSEHAAPDDRLDSYEADTGYNADSVDDDDIPF